MNIGTVREFVT